MGLYIMVRGVVKGIMGHLIKNLVIGEEVFILM